MLTHHITIQFGIIAYAKKNAIMLIGHV